MFKPDDTIHGPCPTHCGGVVLTFGPTVKAARLANGIDTSTDDQPRCDHCDTRWDDRHAYIKALRAWRERVMGAADHG